MKKKTFLKLLNFVFVQNINEIGVPCTRVCVCEYILDSILFLFFVSLHCIHIFIVITILRLAYVSVNCMRGEADSGLKSVREECVLEQLELVKDSKLVWPTHKHYGIFCCIFFSA